MGNSVHSPRFGTKATGSEEAVSSGVERKISKRRRGLDHIQQQNRQEKTKNREQLKCFYTNANSLVQKIDELKDLVRLHECDIISVTETWVTADITDAELSIEGFSMYRVD